jgi:hypothetical protein
LATNDRTHFHLVLEAHTIIQARLQIIRHFQRLAAQYSKTDEIPECFSSQVAAAYQKLLAYSSSKIGDYYLHREVGGGVDG